MYLIECVTYAPHDQISSSNTPLFARQIVLFCQELITRSLFLTYWGLKATFARVDLFLVSRSSYVIIVRQPIKRRAMTMGALRYRSTRQPMTQREVLKIIPLRKKLTVTQGIMNGDRCSRFCFAFEVVVVGVGISSPISRGDKKLLRKIVPV